MAALLSATASAAFDTSTTTGANSPYSRKGDSKFRGCLLTELFPNRSLGQPSRSRN